jgi:hypothetical protein
MVPRRGLARGANQLNEIKALSSSVIELVYHRRGLNVERAERIGSPNSLAIFVTAGAFDADR